MTCNLCKRTDFKTISDLRRHQWAEHRDIYKTVGRNFVGHNGDAHRKNKNGHKRRTAPIATLHKNGATLAEVIEALKIERDSINDTIARLEAFDNAKIE